MLFLPPPSQSSEPHSCFCPGCLGAWVSSSPPHARGSAWGRADPQENENPVCRKGGKRHETTNVHPSVFLKHFFKTPRGPFTSQGTVESVCSEKSNLISSETPNRSGTATA